MNFRKVLLNRCQKEFEKDKDDDEIIERKRKELDSASEVRRCCGKENIPAIFLRFSLKSTPAFLLGCETASR